MRQLLGATLLILATSSWAEIYKWRDDSGTLHFSDQKPPANYNPVTVDVDTGSHTQSTQSSESNDGEASASAPEHDQTTPTPPPAPTRYSQIRLTSPAPNASIRSNNGSLSLNCTTTPALSQEAGHKVRFFIDGQVAATSSRCQHTLTNVNRGEHTASAAVIDAGGKTLIKSPTVKFFLLRASAL